MKSIFLFLRSTITGGVLFMLPLALMVFLFKKAHEIMLTISQPLADRMPEVILGFDGSNLLAIVLLLLLCFISGLLFRSRHVRQGVSSLEENLLSYLPGYALLKSITADAVGDNTEPKMATVLVSDEGTWRIGFLVEEVGNWCTVFIPDAPRHDAGEVKIVPLEKLRRIKETTGKTARIIQRYGRGADKWLENVPAEE
jgi:uncharacterized membrane protein